MLCSPRYHFDMCILSKLPAKCETLSVKRNGMKFLIKNWNGKIFGIIHKNALYPIKLKICNGNYYTELYIQKNYCIK